LELNPEFYTVWNIRRRCLLASIIAKPADPSTPYDDKSVAKNTQTLSQELALTTQHLRRVPKCYWIWSYRMWTLEQVIAILPRSLARAQWQSEFDRTGKMLALDQRNFHAWGYRQKVVARLENDPALALDDDEGAGQQKAADGGHQSGRNARSMAEQEFAFTETMIKLNLSNYSAWHRRSELIARLLDERDAGPADRKKMLQTGL